MILFDKIVLIVAILLCAYCPWISYDQALAKFQESAVQAKSLTSYCDYTIKDGSLAKRLFGWSATVTYDCNYGGTEHFPSGDQNIFLTFFEVVVNMPHPLIR